MSEALLRLLADASMRVAVLAVLVSAILTLFQVRASAVRHAVWTGLLSAMLLMPVLPSVLPGIAIPAPSQVPLVSSALGLANIALEDAGSAAPVARSREVRRSQASPGADAAPAPMPLVPVVWNAEPFPWPTLIAGAYAAGVSISLLCLLIGWRAANRLKRNSRLISINGEQVSTSFCNLRVHESAVVATPLTIGIIRPTIILPLSWQRWSSETLTAVLAHETAHVTRRDPLGFFMARINRCLFWFHPVAWWLERRLAASAEQASDEQAVRVTGQRQRYAEILVDMARTVSRQGGRLSWQAIGIGGNGLLRRRIDRVLQEREHRLPAPRKVAVAASCAAVTLLVTACQLHSSTTPYELTAAETQREDRLRTELERLWSKQLNGLGPYRQVTRDEVTSLELAVQKDPENMDAVKALLLAYWCYGAPDPNALGPRAGQDLTDTRMAGARRDRILWLIERHPESDLTGSVEGRIFPTAVVPAFPADPDGYQRARAIWLQHLEKPTVSAAVLGNAASFVETSEPALAEQLLLRARSTDPQGPWPVRLGRLHGSVLTSFVAPRHVWRIGEYRSNDPFAQGVRRKLGESTDETLLTAAGWFMARAPRSSRMERMESDPVGWAESCFKRVLLLNPKAVFAHAEMLAAKAQLKRSGRVVLWSPPLVSRYESISALPDAERFEQLPDRARFAYHGVVVGARWNDPNLREHIAIEKTQARLFAEDALKLAPRFRDHPAYGTAILTANLTLGSLALAEGNRQQALEYLRKAARAPVSEELTYGEDVACDMFVHLPDDLLVLGERDAVADYLERMAAVSLTDRSKLREKAAAIRRGESPRCGWRA